ncbi:recombination regulator RecX [Wielerella bovis]|uniref:recombination regulator RecX n=1 Tax=Wielerella bovis TaxID=2917790 RepID=UPI002019BA2C|nr:recombination regulator RecX [Wielerella bovis]ULJ61659.1 recombination regulator RecX [Wielerella bovis]ULJ70306.1 recombination regulator RecX [Wielerella bovis]
MKPQKSLRARAMDIVSRREVSRLELQRKLAPYAEDADELESVLNEFAAQNWQSDERYVEAFINSKSRKHGAMRLRQELASKGVDEDLVCEYLPDEETERENAAHVLRKKFKQPAADYAEKQKQIRFLLYRGFDMDTIHAVMKTAWDEEE